MILRESLGGEKVEGAGVGVGEDCVEDGQVVTQSFAAGGRSDDHDIFAGVDGFCGAGLMRVELANALGGIGFTQIGMNPVGEFCPLCGARRIAANGGENFAVGVAFGEGVEDSGDVGEGRGRGGSVPNGSDGGQTNGERVGHSEALQYFAFCSLRLAWRFRGGNSDFW